MFADEQVEVHVGQGDIDLLDLVGHTGLSYTDPGPDGPFDDQVPPFGGQHEPDIVYGPGLDGGDADAGNMVPVPAVAPVGDHGESPVQDVVDGMDAADFVKSRMIFIGEGLELFYVKGGGVGFCIQAPLLGGDGHHCVEFPGFDVPLAPLPGHFHPRGGYPHTLVQGFFQDFVKEPPDAAVTGLLKERVKIRKSDGHLLPGPGCGMQEQPKSKKQNRCPGIGFHIQSR